MNNQKEIVLSCTNIRKNYKEGKLAADVLRGVNLSVQSAEKIAILGTSGSGKSTLLHLLGGLDKPSSGEIKLLGKPFHNRSANSRAYLRNQYLGFIYQFHHLLPEFTALENVAMPLLLQKKSIKDANRCATKILKNVDMSHRLKHKPSELSGGERQRVAIARALINDPKCVLADEPTGNLDEENAKKVFDLMCQLSSQLNTSFIIVTHDKNLASKMDRTCELHNGILLNNEN